MGAEVTFQISLQSYQKHDSTIFYLVCSFLLPPHFPLDLTCCPNSMLYFVFCFVLLFFKKKSHFFRLSEFSDECQTFVLTLFYRRMHFVIVNHMYSMCFMTAVYKCTYIYFIRGVLLCIDNGQKQQTMTWISKMVNACVTNNTHFTGIDSAMLKFVLFCLNQRCTLSRNWTRFEISKMSVSAYIFRDLKKIQKKLRLQRKKI